MEENEKKRLMKLKNDKDFNRQNSHKQNRVGSSWRRARGHHSGVRLGKKYSRDSPNPGYRSPEAVRGLHPSGLEDVLVHRPEELDGIDPEEQGVRIASKVGGRKREKILEKAEENDIHVFNSQK